MSGGEKTSINVASLAGWIMKVGPKFEQVIKHAEKCYLDAEFIDFLRQYKQNAESCAGSALTQKEPESGKNKD